MLFFMKPRKDGVMSLPAFKANNGEQVWSINLVEKFAGQVPRGGKGFYWAHPVVCAGRLYIRHDDSLYVYKIKK